MKHLLAISLLVLLISVTVSCDKNDKESEPPQMPIKNLVMPDEPTLRFWGESVIIQGEGFIESSELWIGETDKQKAAIAGHTSAGITFVVPEGVEGLHNITLRQAGSDWPLGKLTFAKPEDPRGIVSGIHVVIDEEKEEVYSGDFSIEYDEKGNITKLGAPANCQNGNVYYCKRQGDKLIITHAWMKDGEPESLSGQIIEATLDDKGRAVTAKRIWNINEADKDNAENLVFHYSDSGEIKDFHSDYEYKSEHTWKDSNILSTKITSLNGDEVMFGQQISSPYENRTNIDFADILTLINSPIFGPINLFGAFLPRSLGCLGNMDKNLPEEMKWFTPEREERFTIIKYSYVLDDNGRPKSIVVTSGNGGEETTGERLILTISYKN